MKYSIEQVKEYIKNSHPESKIYVGCDSKQNRNHTLFATAIVVHHEGNKGAKVFPFIEKVPRIRSMNQRLAQEVYYATFKALEISDVVGNRELKVHLDYHPSTEHKSNRVVKQSIGFVLGQGLEYELKPHAHAASSAADYLGRNGGVIRKRRYT